MHKYSLHDVVRLLIDLPDEGVKVGAVGTIVLLLEVPPSTYEVEFADDEGRTIAEVALHEDAIELLARASAFSDGDKQT